MKSHKHQLLATTALVAAATMGGGSALAEAMKPALSLGGFFNHSTHFADQDSRENKGNVSSRNNIEIYFNASGEMDNGMKVGGRVQLEGAKAGSAADESWISLSSDWGQIRAGYMQSGRYGHTFDVQAPSAAYGVSSGHAHFWFDSPADSAISKHRFLRPAGSVNTDIGENEPTITYYTPRFNGFQLTGSYRYGINEVASDYGRVANEDTEYSNAIDGSIQYSGDMGGVAVSVMLGAAGATGPNTVVDGSCGNDDYAAMNAGVKLSAQGFTVGAQIADVDDELRCASGTAMHAGAMYGQGPWAVSITAFDGEAEQSTAPGDATYTAWSLGFGYTLGPGLKLVTSYQDVEYDGEGTDQDDTGQAFMVGFNVGF